MPVCPYIRLCTNHCAQKMHSTILLQDHKVFSHQHDRLCRISNWPHSFVLNWCPNTNLNRCHFYCDDAIAVVVLFSNDDVAIIFVSNPLVRRVSIDWPDDTVANGWLDFQ